MYHSLLSSIINRSGWSELIATDINDNGQIVGQGVYNGTTRGFLMNPITIPEPTTLMLLGVGSLFLRAKQR